MNNNLFEISNIENVFCENLALGFPEEAEYFYQDIKSARGSFTATLPDNIVEGIFSSIEKEYWLLAIKRKVKELFWIPY